MKSSNKAVVGIFVAGCLVLFTVGLFLIGNSNQLFTRSFNIYAEFSKITGIVKGGKVRVAGMDAGTVTKIDVPARPGAKFRVHFRIVDTLHPIVRADSIASIQTDGLLGNKYLEIDAGSPAQPLAKMDSLIGSTEPLDWGDLMDEISNAVKQVNGVLSGAKEQLTSTLAQIEGASRSANLLMQDARPQVKSILASANAVGENLREIIDGVQQGKGTAGALFKDPALEASVKRSVENAEQVVDNLRQTTASAKRIVAKVDDSDIVPEVQRTVTNLQQITLQVKGAVDKFQGASGEGGASETLQRTLADAHEAISDLADDTEALKHNFFFRGFFKNRGFYDLGAITTPEYKKAAFGKGFKKYRVWLESSDIFVKAVDGSETLSAEGKRRLEDAMTSILRFPRNGPLMIEGFPGAGTSSEQYLQGRRRAAHVERYLVDRYHLRPAYVGLVSLAAEPDPASVSRFKEGVGIVSFYK